MEENKNIKSMKKCRRKQKRAQHRLIRDMNIEHSKMPTQYVAICNAGLVTGLQREILEQFIKNIMSDFNVTMPPGKSYCFVNFSTAVDAQHFYNKVHGIAQVPNQNTVFYLIFITNIPDTEEVLGNDLPPGLRLVADFISSEEESFLLQSINWDEEEDAESQLKHRKVKHFGYKFRYDNNSINVDDPMTPIPPSYEFLQSLFDKHSCGQFKYDQLTINRYLPGQGIPPHIDTHSAFEDTILSLSLGSVYVMNFKQGEKKVALDLPARSLLIISGESRYAWSHGICPRHNDNVATDNGFSTRSRGTRVSFTFRKIRQGDCQCKYRKYCDSAKNTLNVTPIDNSKASELENLYVHDVYEEISGHFNETRHKQWPNVAKFIESVDTGGLLLDVGCGNGKYLHGHTHLFKMGCDRSTGLVEICRSKGFQITLADCLQLPYRSNVLDAVLCIAVIHHLSTNERRKQSIYEIVRVLRPSGRALVYVWAKEQNKDSVKSTYLNFGASKTKKDYANTSKDEMQFRTTENNLTLPIHENRTEFTHSDMLVPWKRKGGGDFLRFYHVFVEGELERLCSDVPSTKIHNVYYDQGNWCAVLEKTCSEET